MKRVLLVACLASAATAWAEGGDPFTSGSSEAGATKAATCVACHGVNGNSTNPEWPKLAGQSSKYVAGQLAAFKSGTRKQPIMQAQAAPLSDQDMRDLGAYFAGQKQQPGVASPDSVKVAEKLFRAGDAARGLPACAACHGPNGAGNPGAGYPRVGGQHATYTANQLKLFRAGERVATANGKIMSDVAAKLTDPEIQALASYVNGLQ